MSRGLDTDPRDPELVPSRAPAGSNAGGTDTRAQGRAVALDTVLSRDLESSHTVRWRDRDITLTASQAATLRTVGAFRTVAVPDLAKHRFGESHANCLRELRQLERHGWLEARTMPASRGGRACPVVTLTREGHAFVREHLRTGAQRHYRGLVRPKEQAHDAALYRVAVAESERLRAAGSTVTRVVLDAELKAELASARNRPGTDAPAARTEAAANSLHLKVVDGRVQIPDLRLEYETRDGEVGRVDLELATEHYRPSQVAAKARAGFTIYAPAHQTGRLTAALHDRGIMADILSL